MTNTDLLRLSRHVLPINYNLTLTPAFDNWTFKGSEIIDVEVFSDGIKEVRLYAIELTITKAKFNGNWATITFNTELEQMILTFIKPITKGKGILELEFSGSINDYMRGFYRSMYRTECGELSRMAVTQFEPTDARRAFPCWDEPNFKATFDVTLIVPKEYVVMSNMPELSRSSVTESQDEVKFDKTPPMSTYLLAFVIGDFDCIKSEDDDENGLQIHVFTVKNKSQRGKFALDVCRKVMKFYTNYFNIAYPLPKLDLIAIPDFVHGAMENWGIMTFRETSLFIDDIESSIKSKRWVAHVIAHECAHMWFGNLVTIDWWNDLWLSEGFATWVSSKAIYYCYPEYDAWSDFSVEHYNRAFQFDSLKSSHPIQGEIHKTSEIIEYFDTISYSKGACLINMLNDYVTEEKFRRSLNLYLYRHKFKNARSEDIWDTLQEVTGEPISEIMNTWLTQVGYPLISVRAITNEKDETIAMSFKQTRYSAQTSSNSESLWFVPVTLSPVNNPKKTLAKILLRPTDEEQFFYLSHPQPDLVRLNAGAVAFYQVHYENDILPAFTAAFSNGNFSPMDRLRLAYGVFSVANCGLIPIATALNFIRGYASERNFHVWHSIIGSLKNLYSLIDEMDSTLICNMDQLIVDLLEPIYLQLSWNESDQETHNDTMLRSLVITNLGRIGHKDIIWKAMNRFNFFYYRLNDSTLSPNLRTAVYSTVLKHGNTLYYYKVLDLLKRTDLDEERMRIYKSLGSVSDINLPNIYKFTMTDHVRKLDKVYIFLNSVNCAKKRSLLWDFVRTNWNEIVNDVFGFTLDCFSGFASIERFQELQIFLHPYSSHRSTQIVLETIENNIAILERESDNLREYFS